MHTARYAAIAAFALELVPAALFAFAAQSVTRIIRRCPPFLRIALPALAVVPYLIVVLPLHAFKWNWAAIYTLLPVCITWLLTRAAQADPEQRGNWRDAAILLLLGLAVDLRWFNSAWPRGLGALGKLLLVDVGLYGFLAIRQLTGTGFDLRLQWSDWKTGLRELAFFTPPVLLLGFFLGFIHLHANLPGFGTAILRWLEIFLFVALPEELFFRSWMQNLLERRTGRIAALVIASILFGLSHFNKRNTADAHFNWRYVLLASIAGIFYGRAWRERRRMPASMITHTFVDWIWSWWF